MAKRGRPRQTIAKTGKLHQEVRPDPVVVLYWLPQTINRSYMPHHSRMCLGSLIITVSLILSALAFLHCSSKSSSLASLERLSSNGHWSKAESVLVSRPIIGRNADTIVATIRIRTADRFSNEELVLQTNLARIQNPIVSIDTPTLTLMRGSAIGKLNGSLFQAQKVNSNFVKLMRNDDGKLVFGGTFNFGMFRVRIPLIEAEEAKSSQDARLRFGNFDGDRVPKGWDLEEIVQGAIQTFTEGPAIPTSRVQEAKILAWRISEDFRSLRIQECTVWIRLNNPSQWMLVHVARNRLFQEGWSSWFRAWEEHVAPVWVESYNHPPARDEIELFLDANKWQTGRKEFRILDAEVCTNAWKKVTGQQPTKAFM